MPKGPGSTPAGSGRGGRAPQRPPPRSASRRKRERRRLAPAAGARRRSFWRRREGVITGAAFGVVVIALIAAIVALRATAGGTTKSGAKASATPSATPTATPLAAVSAGLTGQTVDGVQCQSGEKLTYHIHAHLAIFVDGVARSVPPGIGIPQPRTVISTDAGPYVEGNKCYYWLHSHTGDGIIHVESPTQTTYTLGQFFDIWQQALSTAQVGPDSGTVFVYVNGQKFTGDPKTVPLTAHELIQLDVGTDVPPKPFSFPPGL